MRVRHDHEGAVRGFSLSSDVRALVIVLTALSSAISFLFALTELPRRPPFVGERFSLCFAPTGLIAPLQDGDHLVGMLPTCEFERLPQILLYLIGQLMRGDGVDYAVQRAQILI